MASIENNVVFLGGADVRVSVRIRCVQIASSLGCEYITDVGTVSDVPRDKTVFVCIKPDLKLADLRLLASRGCVVWDVHDSLPPEQFVSHYLVSSRSMAEMFGHLSPITVIPHHHCNLGQGLAADREGKILAWIGRSYWCPNFEGLPIHVFNSNIMQFDEVVNAYGSMRICINLRRQTDDSAFHARINGGGKLINCMGFGIPSISGDEPAYHEFGEECTVFSDIDRLPDALYRLTEDRTLYFEMRERCLERGRDFHIGRILLLYRAFLEALI